MTVLQRPNIYAQTELPGLVQFQQWNQQSQNNHAYAPVLFESEEQLLEVEAKLKENNIIPRRYFYPSLDNLDYLQSNQVCSISRDIASRILCVSIYLGLTPVEQFYVIKVIKDSL